MLKPIDPAWNMIRIEHLNYVYHTEDSNASFKGIKNFDLVINKGNHIALVGHNGSGKSTLLSVLSGLIMPSNGCKVTVDGSLETIDQLRNLVTLVSQDQEIFEDTIFQNLTLGLPFSDDSIINVCKMTDLHDLILELPNKFETHLSENGVNLS